MAVQRGMVSNHKRDPLDFIYKYVYKYTTFLLQFTGLCPTISDRMIELVLK